MPIGKLASTSREIDVDRRSAATLFPVASGLSLLFEGAGVAAIDRPVMITCEMTARLAIIAGIPHIF
ncbi:hypothetical protein DXM21_23185 [Agrobacterium rosae]|nr:hypothetical protein DXM21_23185 [Agrobacterium rosae]KAA3513473.1 hypothetical protein DXM25_23380 [Agrobacterium rosae]MQB51029.1 hypothetical protein [Agrobacterium rosae]